MCLVYAGNVTIVTITTYKAEMLLTQDLEQKQSIDAFNFKDKI
jgi:hypothetical protein